MRSRDLIKLMTSETGIPDYSHPERVVWKSAEGRYHRDFGPAITCSDGTQQWFKDGRLHREDGPALVWPDGTKEWFCNGKLHRVGGPAYVGAAGAKEWWINGKRI